MKLKTKLVSLVISFVMVVSALVVGVLALQNTNFEVSGDISFKAKGIEATITNAALSGASFTDGGVIGTNRCDDIAIVESTAESDLTEDYNSWKSLALQFDDDVATLSFTITNTKPETKDFPFMSVEVGINSSSLINSYIQVSNSNGGDKIYLASGESADYTITFYVNDKAEDASISDFVINFALDRMTVTPEESEVQLSYNSTGNFYYVTMGSYNSTPIDWRLASFDGVHKFNATKSTPPTMYESVEGDTAYNNIVFIQETIAMGHVFNVDSSVPDANDYAGSDMRAYLINTSETDTGNSFMADLNISSTNIIYNKIQVKYGGKTAGQEYSLYDDIEWRVEDVSQVKDGTPQTEDDNSDHFWLMSIKEMYTLLGGGRVVDEIISRANMDACVDDLLFKNELTDTVGVNFFLRSAHPFGTHLVFVLYGDGQGPYSGDAKHSAYVRAAFYLNF